MSTTCIRVQMLKTQDDLQAGQWYDLPRATAIWLVEQGAAVCDSGAALGSHGIADTGTTGRQFVDGEIPEGVIDGVNIIFTLRNAPNPPGSLALFKNGMKMSAGSDFTLDGSVIRYIDGQVPQVPDSHSASYRYY